ncbi:MAG: hypothetical protein L0H64_07360 [Pseudonocardia sp.]|nr:hypothetical protein [Pseudonocardia sp.]
MSNAATHRRHQVIGLRIRLERVAVGAFTAVCCPKKPPRASSIETRLLFLVGLVEDSRGPGVHRLARLGQHVYRRTSDVLHGRTNALDLSDVVADEWRAVVADMEKVLGDAAGPVERRPH